jgi:hypothetical protein
MRWMIADENLPFLVAREDEAGFAAGLARLAGDPALRRRIGAANREKALREFDLKTMCDAYDALFGAIAARPCDGQGRNGKAKLDLHTLVRQASLKTAKEKMPAADGPSRPAT